ncbi:protein crumbs homolog 1-like [Oncorhynchus keta]|uniref:protein crumbs homolog 1-like n=1 Tax=Oncorhynchus keta TaxID=8018 RepID=UPI00227B1C7F|nr:protein crumbs homolog 1-like [Oncorhynchus keta]
MQEAKISDCLHIYTGATCEEDTNTCELLPCQNGGICESHHGGYRCLCSRQSQDGHLYGGENCTVALLGCDGNRCKNGSICSPLFLNDRHTYTCTCRAGFTGSKCQTSTIFSFETSGYMYVETQLSDPEVPLNVTLSFRTDRHAGTLLQRQVEDLLLTIELVDSHLRLSMLRGQESKRAVVLELPPSVSDGQWHTVEAWLGSEAEGSGIRLRQSSCDEVGCTKEFPTTETPLLEQGSGLSESGSVRHSLFLGGVGLGWGSGVVVGKRMPEAADPSVPLVPPAHFLGCFRDVFVESRLVVPAPANSPAQINVTAGCSDKDKCDDNPCQNRGHCTNQGWRSYVCECYRPYKGTTDCAEEYIPAKFGYENVASYAVFSLDDPLGSGTITISMFVRTRRPSGLLLVLANSTSQYLRLWLDDGRVKVQVNNFESLAGSKVVSDGHFHLVTVQLEGDSVTLFQSAQSHGTIPIRPVVAHPGDLVYVGGLSDQRASASFGGYLKGCVQDLRINNKRLQFFPIGTPVASYGVEELVNVTQGCMSDNVCSNIPCLNGGVCYSMWDDFICNCPPNIAGRRCEVVKWCELSPCPSTAACQTLSQGFECVSNVTLRNDSILSYRGNGKIRHHLSSVLLSVRTRQTNATLLHTKKGSEFITISLQDSHLLLELQAGGGKASPKLTAQSRGLVSDGKWHMVELSMEAPDLQTSRWIMVLDGGRDGVEEEHVVSKVASGSLAFLREGVDILLGGLGPEAGGNLNGCLGPVQIGGLPLPYYEDTDLNIPRPQEGQFVRTPSAVTPLYGCRGASVCTPNPCQNQGVCEELFDLSLCRCPPEWMGSQCQNDVDTCAVKPCVHGNCSVLGEGYLCACEPGYGGTRCEKDVDTCENNKCGPEATCLRGLLNYACHCPRNMTGPFCDEKVPEVPWYIEKIPYPNLPTSVCPGDRWNYSCFNGGNCSKQDYTCDCLPGFIGQWCEIDFDECASGPCEYGGYCHNLVNHFHCICEMNFSGDQCQIDVSDFYLYLALLQFQYMFQLMSYLILHLDDGPEIDWGQLQIDDD